MSQLQVTGEAKIRDIQGPVVANSGVITALDGAASQYVRGDGTLADFPTSTGGGSSVSYYLNSSVSQGTIGGVAYRELSKEPIIGAGTDITISANGYVASYITDANDPDVLSVPGGNFNCEFYFSVNNNTGNPTTYAELYKYDGTTFTLLGSSVAVPESLNQGTTIAPYYFAIPVATAALALTDRLAIRIYVSVDGRVVTLHTENSHLCQVVTTFSKGMVSLNNLTDQSQFITTGTTGTNFNIVSTGDTHTFNLPVASATNTGKLSSTDWSTFNNKVPYTGATGDVDLGGYSLSSRNLTANGNAGSSGSLHLKQNDTINVAGINYGTIATNTLQQFVFYWENASFAKRFNLDFSSLTALGTAKTFTLPDLSGTLALLEGTQTFSGAKTFSLDILVNGLTIGRGAGSISTNTVVGSSALSANTTGYGNTSIGLNNLIANTTGFFNVAIGASSLISNTTGTYNAALGTSSLYNNTTGSNNTAVGQQAGESNTTGSNNTYIGWGSGYGIQTGSNNTIIGAYTGTAALANNIVLADGAGNVRYRYDGTNNNLYGNVNFSSTIGNGTFTYTLPSATGTLALTSNLSAYLPLTGGTLTGSLAGTSATFSGNFGVGTSNPSAYTNLNTITINGTSGSVIDFKTGEVLYGELYSLANEMRVDAVGASGVLKLLTNSTERMRITSGGNLLLGTTSDPGYGRTTASVYAATGGIMQVAGSSTTALFYVYQPNNTAYIGTTTNHDFAVISNNATRLTIASTGAATFSSSVTTPSITNGGQFKMDYGANASSRSWRLISDSYNFGDFSIQQSTTQSGSTYADRLLISANGNVGIGTSSPDYPLVVQANSSGAQAVKLLGRSVDNISILSFHNNANSTQYGYIAGIPSEFRINSGSSIPITFTNLDTERMRITSGGNVGIGTSSPYANLDLGASGANNIILRNTSNAYNLGYIGNAGGKINIGFSNSNSSLDPLPYLSVTSSGNVGIGTSSPSQKLTIDASNGYPFIDFKVSGTGYGDIGYNTAASAFTIGAYSTTPMAFYTNSAERMRITSGGSLLVGTTSIFASGKVCSDGGTDYTPFAARVGTTANAGQMYFVNPNGIVGSITTSGTSTAFNTSSDYRLKQDLKDYNALSLVSAIKTYDYEWKSDNSRSYGVLAHELQEVLPQAVNGEKDGENMQGVDYSKIVPVLVKAIQELKAEIDILKNK